MIGDLTPRYRLPELLPHGPSMRLLDELIEYGHEHVSCSVAIRSDSLFAEPGRGVPSWVGVEYMAQVMAAYSGILRLQAGRQVQIGLLLGTRSYQCELDWFTPGTVLQVRADLLVLDTTGVAAFACTLGDSQRIWARAEIKAFQPEDISSYLQELAREEQQ